MNKTLKFFLIFIPVIALIAGGITLYLYMNRHIPAPEGYIGNTTGNLNNHALFCESGDYVYFSNPYDQKKLYKMKPDGTEAQCISDVPSEFINVFDKRVYFFQDPGAENQIFGLGGLYGVCYTDTKGTSGLHNLDKTLVNSLVMYGDNLYYQHYDASQGLTLYRASCDGKTREEISKKKIYVSCPYNGGFLTYNTENGYYLSGYNPENDSIGLFAEIRAYNIINEGGYIYYMNIDDDYKIYRYNISASTNEKITDCTVDLFNVYGSSIFFQRNSQTDPALMRINADGTGEQIIAAGNYTNINCTSTYTYFYEFGNDSVVYRVPTYGGSAERFQPVLK